MVNGTPIMAGKPAPTIGGRGRGDGSAWIQPSEPWDDTAPTPMDMRDVQVPVWMRSGADASTNQGAAWGARSWKRGRWYGLDGGGTQGRHAYDDEVTEDHEAAARLQAQHNDAAAAAAAAASAVAGAAPATPTPIDQALEDRKRAVWDMAQAESVQVSCEEIASMDAVQLEAWATEHIGQI